jgi:hypothetical protein
VRRCWPPSKKWLGMLDTQPAKLQKRNAGGATDSPPPCAMASRKDARRCVVRDANGQALAYVYSRATETDVMQAEDEARRVAANIARPPQLLGTSE